MDSSLIRVRSMRPLARPSSLKDHLLMDDMSSSSSNGFKSFPRRSHCCTTVRFLHNLNRKTPQERRMSGFWKNNKTVKEVLVRRRSALSAFAGVFSAVKRLPFAAGTPGEMKLGGRSLSRKMSGFWKKNKTVKEGLGRRRSSDQVTKDESKPLSVSGDGSGDIKSDIWSSGSDFTVSDDFLSSGKCSSPEVTSISPEKENDVVKYGEVSPEKEEISAESKSSKSTSSDRQQKEQFSPVSILDCSFDEEEEDEVSSRFRCRLARVEGTKAKLMKKIETFEGLAKLEPINLVTKFDLRLDSDHNYSTDEKSPSGVRDEEDKDQLEALELMRQMKDTHLPSLDLEVETLVMDFFREKILDERANSRKGKCGPWSIEKGPVEEAWDWITGEKDADDHFVGWEVEKGRRAYINDMEKRGESRGLDEERDEVAMELENVFFVELMDELMREISI